MLAPCRRLAAPILLVVGLYCLASPSARAEPHKDLLRFAYCDQASLEYEAVLTGRIVLARDFLDPQLSEDENLLLGIRQQVRYLWGYLHNDPRSKRDMKVVLWSAPPEVEILRKQDADYGYDLTLDWPKEQTLVPELRITDAYTKRAVDKGAIGRGARALTAEYRARFKLALCRNGGPKGGQLSAPLPPDPWLAHWHVPAAERRKLTYFRESAITNPCVDDDYADLPHPIYHWYDWMPYRDDKDANGRPIQCRKLLKEGVDYFTRTAKLSPLPTSGPDFRQLQAGLGEEKGPLRVTLIIGVHNHDWQNPDYPGLLAELSGGDPAAQALAALARPKLRERGTQELLAVLRDLPEITASAAANPAAERRMTGHMEGDYLVLEVQAVLRHSGRPLRLRLVHGLTDVLGPTPPRHWPLAKQALAQEQVVIYVGHSGVGENMRLSRIAAGSGGPREQVLADVAAAPYQLVAFLSCYSYMYFGLDLIEVEASKTSPRREFVFTGTPFSDGDRGSLAVLDFVDSLLAGTIRPGGGQLPKLRFVAPKAFFIFKGFQ
jgi:hypothetical protein